MSSDKFNHYNSLIFLIVINTLTDCADVHFYFCLCRKNEKLKLQDIQHRFMTDQVLQQCFPSVKQLYELAMLIPPSTAVVERGFSLMNNILTPKRNRLSQRQLEGVMRICHTEVKLQSTDLEKLVDDFKGLKKRKRDM